MICAMAALTMLATACKDKGEQFEINGRIAEADGKTLYFEAVTLNGIEDSTLPVWTKTANSVFRAHVRSIRNFTACVSTGRSSTCP